MAEFSFNPPIYVRRPYCVEEIGSLDDALDFLEGWPSDGRGLIYEMVLRACREAYTEQFPLEAARENFRRFARKTGILASSPD